MKLVRLFLFSLLLGLSWMLTDIQMTLHKEKVFDNFAKLSRIYKFQIEKNDFVYRKIDE